jgi:FkbM family methyltransferase
MGKQVVAIEPLERNVRLLKQNVISNQLHGVEIFQMAIGRQSGLEKIYGGGTAASLVRGWAGAKQSAEVVSVNTLDHLLAGRFGDEIPLILIDVEGFELSVLKGASSVLAREPAPIWFIEICIDEHQPDCFQINPNLLETFNAFWAAGYQCEKAGSDRGLVSEHDVKNWCVALDIPKTHNFIFRKI